MQRYKLVIQYDGTPYVEFQVQERMEIAFKQGIKALKKMTKGQPFLVALVAHRFWSSGQWFYRLSKMIEAASLVRAMNSLLPAVDVG